MCIFFKYVLFPHSFHFSPIHFSPYFPAYGHCTAIDSLASELLLLVKALSVVPQMSASTHFEFEFVMSAVTSFREGLGFKFVAIVV